MTSYLKNSCSLIFYKDNKEYYFNLNEVLFFETSGETVYSHTAQDSFIVKYRLYELEGFLPNNFIRISKSTVLNKDKISILTRNLAAASLIEFADTHKKVYVSRHYFKALKLQEKR